MAGASERASGNIAGAEHILFELQVEQHHHDEDYHREIARLSLHQRLNHMALHFAKYAGKLAAAARDEPDNAYVDTLIIALSTANILNVRLWDLLERGGYDYPNLLVYGRDLMQRLPMDSIAFLRAYAAAAGRIAAACEKIDHLEDFSYRQEIGAGIATLATLATGSLATQGVDPVDAVHKRLAGVKARLKLHGRV